MFASRACFETQFTSIHHVQFLSWKWNRWWRWRLHGEKNKIFSTFHDKVSSWFASFDLPVKFSRIAKFICQNRISIFPPWKVSSLSRERRSRLWWKINYLHRNDSNDIIILFSFTFVYFSLAAKKRRKQKCPCEIGAACNVTVRLKRWIKSYNRDFDGDFNERCREIIQRHLCSYASPWDAITCFTCRLCFTFKRFLTQKKAFYTFAFGSRSFYRGCTCFFREWPSPT